MQIVFFWFVIIRYICNEGNDGDAFAGHEGSSAAVRPPTCFSLSVLTYAFIYAGARYRPERWGCRDPI